MAKFIKAHDAWCAKVDTLGDDAKQPREPKYRGPTDWELALAEKRVSIRKWQLEFRHAKFQRKQAGNTLIVNVNKNIYQDVRDAGSPEEAMKQYAAILDLRPNGE